MLPYQDILFETKDRVATITLNRPEKLNAFRSRTIQEFSKALTQAIRDTSVQVIVIAGSGGRAFSVGGDIEEMQSLTQKTGRVFVQKLWQLGRLLLTCPKPIIAKVNGYCLGGGNEIQLFCDLTIASDTSVFGQVGPKVGSAPLWGGTQILPALTGLKKTKEIIFLCNSYSAKEAVEMGLINQSVPESELEATVHQITHNLLQKSPQSLRLVKQALHQDFLKTLKRDLKKLSSLYGSMELKEGMTAFLEKRQANYQ